MTLATAAVVRRVKANKWTQRHSQLRRGRFLLGFITAFRVVAKVKRAQKFLQSNRIILLQSQSLPLRDNVLPTRCGTLLKEETLCSRGLRLLAVAAAVSCAVSACNCTTRPASRACSRDGWSFCCCCICTLWTSCCSYNRQQFRSREKEPL